MSKLRILIVEDEALTARDLHDELIGHGYEIAGIADRAEDAVQMVKINPPDLVLMDIRLAGAADGIEAACAMLRLEIPVIFLTALYDVETLERAKTARPVGYLPKPIEPRQLLVSIEMGIERHRNDMERKRLVRELAGKQEQVGEHAAKLETTVAERTGELRAAVAALEREIGERQRLEREVLEIGEREQCRLGRDLHDDLGQQLAGIEMFAYTHQARLEAETHPAAADAAHLVACLNAALQTTRSLAKSFFPVELERGGLTLALEDLAHRTELLAKIRCQVAADAGFWIEKESAIHLYRIVQEAIGNALKHASAHHIAIECRVGDNGARTVRVSDDGVGFKVPEKAGHGTGIGLHLLQYRARLMGAEVSVQTMTDGTGCQVTCLFAPPPETPLI